MKNVALLDFDDVIVTGPYGVFDLAGATIPLDIHEKLFSKECVEVLREIDREHSPTYVITTSWLRLMQLDDIAALLRKCGLAFVADRLEPNGEAFPVGHETRAGAIERWLSANPRECSFVVLDDAESGTGLEQSERLKGHVVMCEVGVGLQPVHLQQVRQALSVP